jgi:hypothetical protein
MKETLNTSEIADRLFRDENAAWSYAGALALAEYLQEWEDGTGEEMEFDRVAIRCDFSEWKTLEEWAADYFGGTGEAVEELGLDPEDVDKREDAMRNYINGRGTLIEFDGGIIVSSF